MYLSLSLLPLDASTDNSGRTFAAGLAALGADLETPPDPVAVTKPQHLTYSSAFVRELHAFIGERIGDAVVRTRI